VKDAVLKVQQFHETFNCFTRYTPTGRIPEAEAAIRVTLLREELEEYREAAEAGDLTAVADALTDLLYVLFGTFVAHGLQGQVEALFEEVHRSNMSKLDEAGRPVFRADGKVLKSARFSPPDLKSILERAGQE
jgi:predicted HAD superfamily Cof-like phosphohydrolase